MKEWIKEYLFRKCIADAVAMLSIVVVAIGWYPVLLGAFNTNAAWMDVVWSDLVAPALPTELALAGEGVRIAHDAAIKFQRAAVNAAENAKTSRNNLREVKGFRELFKGKWIARGQTERSPMMETWTRLLLLGEAWILKIQISILLRLPFTLRDMLSRMGRRRRDQLVISA